MVLFSRNIQSKESSPQKLKKNITKNKSGQKKPQKAKKTKNKQKLTDDLISEMSISLQELQQKILLDPPSESISEIITLTLRQQLDDKQIIKDENIDHTQVIQWAYEQSKVCEICQKWESEQSIIICQACEDAYHMYCVKLSKYPDPSWQCPICVKQKQENLRKEKLKKISENQLLITDHFQSIKKNIKLCNICKQTQKSDQDLNKCIKCKQSFHAECFYAKSGTKQKISDSPQTYSFDPIGEFLCQFCAKQTFKILLKDTYINEYFKQKIQSVNKIKSGLTFLLPKQPQNEQQIMDCKKCLLYALTTQGLSFSDNLVYDSNINIKQSHNNPNLEPLIQKLGKQDIIQFRQFKEITKYANYGPFMVVYDAIQGFIVKTLSKIPARTLICEYVGSVQRYRDVVFSKNDSIMTLLRTGRAETTLVIVPEKYGNLAKYLSGINNYNSKLKQNQYILTQNKNSQRNKQNVSSIRYDIEGEVRVLLYANRIIKKGEILYYDYNAGGNNNYNTQNFI